MKLSFVYFLIIYLKYNYKGRRIYFKPKKYGSYYEDWFDYCNPYTDYREFFTKDIIYDKYGNAIY